MSPRQSSVVLAALLVAAASLAAATPQRPDMHPLSGRRFAQVMGVGGADWLDRAERIDEEEPDNAIRVIKVVKGSVAADVGAGSGYMTVKLARAVGPQGKVYASDIQPGMLTLLESRIRRDKLSNVVPVLGTDTDPGLPSGSVDLELLVDVYHEFSQPQAMLRKLREALKPGGRLVLLEYRKEDPSIPIRAEHKMSVAEARLEIEAEGFTFTRVAEDLPRQHILIFTRP